MKVLLIIVILIIGIVISIFLGLKFRKERIAKEEKIKKIKEDLKA